MSVKRVLNTFPCYEGMTPTESWRRIVEMDGEPINVPVTGWCCMEVLTNSQGDSSSVLWTMEGEPRPIYTDATGDPEDVE